VPAAFGTQLRKAQQQSVVLFIILCPIGTARQRGHKQNQNHQESPKTRLLHPILISCSLFLPLQGVEEYDHYSRKPQPFSIETERKQQLSKQNQPITQARKD
jgi:hypothetical protein